MAMAMALRCRALFHTVFKLLYIKYSIFYKGNGTLKKFPGHLCSSYTPKRPDFVFAPGYCTTPYFRPRCIGMHT